MRGSTSPGSNRVRFSSSVRRSSIAPLSLWCGSVHAPTRDTPHAACPARGACAPRPDPTCAVWNSEPSVADAAEVGVGVQHPPVRQPAALAVDLATGRRLGAQTLGERRGVVLV